MIKFEMNKDDAMFTLAVVAVMWAITVLTFIIDGITGVFIRELIIFTPITYLWWMVTKRHWLER